MQDKYLGSTMLNPRLNPKAEYMLHLLQLHACMHAWLIKKWLKMVCVVNVGVVNWLKITLSLRSSWRLAT